MTREDILKAAYALFEKEGIRELRMHTIAEKLGLTKPELYGYFDDKRALVSQSVEYGIQQLDDELAAICCKAANPVEMLIRTAVLSFDRFAKMEWIFIEDVEYCPAAIDTIHHEQLRIQRQQPVLFRQAVEEGYMRGEAYYNLLESCFYENFMAQSKERDEDMRTLFTVLRGAATEKDWREVELVRQQMRLEY